MQTVQKQCRDSVDTVQIQCRYNRLTHWPCVLHVCSDPLDMHLGFGASSADASYAYNGAIEAINRV